MVVNQASGQIICTAFDKGRVHDFRLFKLHRMPMLPEQLCDADKGYQKTSCIPIVVLQPSNDAIAKLEKAERQYNRLLSRLRVVAEHVNRKFVDFPHSGTALSQS